MPIISFSKTEQVRQAILLQILSGELRPGQRLLEAKLATELGASQAAVNAALQDLHDQGLVTKLFNRSTNVSQYTAAEIDKLFSVRIVLEPAAVAAVSSLWSNDAAIRLREQVDHMRRAARSSDLAKFCFADYTFHQEVYRLTGNPFLMQACQAIAAAPIAYILCNHLEALPTNYEALAEDHQDLIDAMAQSPAAASRLSLDRILAWRDHSLRALLGIGAAASSR